MAALTPALGAPGLLRVDALALGSEMSFDGLGGSVETSIPQVPVGGKSGRSRSVATHALDDVDVGSAGDSHRDGGVAQVVGVQRGLEARIDEKVFPDRSPARGRPDVAGFVGEEPGFGCFVLGGFLEDEGHELG